MWFTLKRIIVFTFSVAFIIMFNITSGAVTRKLPIDSVKYDGKIISLQTVASSNNDFDQYIKYEIANAVSVYVNELFCGCGDLTYESAVKLLHNEINNIKKLCVKTAEAEDYYENITAELLYPGENSYFSNGYLHEAKYPTLRIVIGDGEGMNCQKIIWEQTNVSNKDIVCEEYTIASSVFPSDVKIDIWLVGAIKNLMSIFN